MRWHWQIGRPFITPPWHRPLPTVKETILLIVLCALFLSALQPYRQFARQHGWFRAGGKLVHDIIEDVEAAGREGHRREVERSYQ